MPRKPPKAVTPSVKQRRCGRWLFVGGASLLALFAAFMTYLDSWGQRDRAQTADCIIVLGARVHADGKASSSLSERVVKAVELYKAGYAPQLIFTGGLGDYSPEESRVAAQLARGLGVPESAITLELQSHSTWENAVNAAALCKTHDWQRVIVVSDPFHLWRANRDFRRLGLTSYPSPSHATWFYRRPGSRLYYDAREVLCVLRDWLLGPH